MKNKLIEVSRLLNLHREISEMQLPELEKVELDSLWHAIERNAKYNRLLWLEEDLARRTKVADSEIVKNKRAIDRYNQGRNDAIEKIDEFLLQEIRRYVEHKELGKAMQHSETAGAIIDKLSIMSLKVVAMQYQVNRSDADELHMQLCKQRLMVLESQRDDLAKCLDSLMIDCLKGKKYFKVYRQYKMYNDPKFNKNILG